LRHKECELCKAVLQVQNIEKIEHIVSDWIVDVEPSCESEGLKHKECEVCETILQLQGIEKTEHNFGEWIETKSASCIQEGEETRYCLTCNNYEETRSTPMISHQLVYVCNDDMHTLVCAVCSHTVDTGVHTYEDDICTECGWHKSIIFECIAPLDEYALGQIYSEEHVFDPTHNYWHPHLGVDFTASAGSEVKCIFDGVVKEISEDGYLGTTVTIEHINGYVSIYKYICDTTLQVGDSIAQGDVIGKVSDTALEESAYGPHLHLELLHYGLKINPLDYMLGVDTSSTNSNL
ncbi:MAG: M23 family metallopeptidase, partial [Clostridia bacterium]|nr:M23 family metallopeptidase [Clostridia bacterium]